MLTAYVLCQKLVARYMHRQPRIQINIRGLIWNTAGQFCIQLTARTM